MDMVNDGKDIRLDTPQAVKEALASGKDLYNPQTGEFWWEYNYTGSIANTNVQLDDPNLLAAIDNPDFDLYEDIVGGLNYTGYITDSIETIIEGGEENAPLIDPRDEMLRIGIAGTPTPSWMASQGTSSVRRMPHSRSPASRASWRCTTPRTTIPRPVTSS